MEDKWINKFQTKLDGFQMNEPEGLWEDIEKALDEKPVPISAGKCASTVPLWIRITAPIAAAAVLLLLVMMQMQYGEKTDDFNHLAVVKEDSGLKQDTVIEDSGSSEMAEPVRKMLRLASRYTQKRQQDSVQIPCKSEPSEAEVPVAEEPSDNPLPQVKKERNYALQENKRHSSLLAKASTSSGLSVDLFASNVSLNLDRMGRDNNGPMMSSDPISGNGNLYDTWMMYYQKPRMEMKHRQPIRLGMVFRYGLSEKLSLGSGLVYSRHSSSVYSVTGTRTHVAEQHLHYLGIPLTVDYNVWNYRNFSVYTSAGVMVEKCVSGEAVDIYSEESTSIKEKAFQFSVNGAVGAQYSLSRHVGVYVEPGVNYYIDNGSSVNNIYKEKPLNFNLEIGLRFTFR